MQNSIKSFFKKDAVFKWSVFLGSILWLINAAFNFKAEDYRAFCINVLYAVCLAAIYSFWYRKENTALHGMLGALMMICVIGNVNVMSEMLAASIPSRSLWQIAVGSVLTIGLFINHFMIISRKTKTLWRVKINQMIIILLLLLRCYQVVENIAAREFPVLILEITVGLIAIVPTLNTIACIESKTDAYDIAA